MCHAPVKSYVGRQPEAEGDLCGAGSSGQSAAEYN